MNWVLKEMQKDEKYFNKKQENVAISGLEIDIEKPKRLKK